MDCKLQIRRTDHVHFNNPSRDVIHSLHQRSPCLPGAQGDRRRRPIGLAGTRPRGKFRRYHQDYNETQTTIIAQTTPRDQCQSGRNITLPLLLLDPAPALLRLRGIARRDIEIVRRRDDIGHPRLRVPYRYLGGEWVRRISTMIRPLYGMEEGW